MATDLGKVGMVMKGDWSNSATYEVLDAVSYNNGLYIAKQAVPAGTLPTNTTYWQTAISAGFPKTAINITAAEGFTIGSNTSYRIGDVLYINLYVTSTADVTNRTQCATITDDFGKPVVVTRFIGSCSTIAGAQADKVNTGYINTSGQIFVGDNSPTAKSFSIILAIVK